MAELEADLLMRVPEAADEELIRAGRSDGRRSDRREDPRSQEPRQVWIHGTDATGAPFEEVREMSNYSRGGFYFVSSLHGYHVGMRLNVIPCLGTPNVEYVAEVVRVEPKPKMAYGIAVQLLHEQDRSPHSR